MEGIFQDKVAIEHVGLAQDSVKIGGMRVGSQEKQGPSDGLECVQNKRGRLKHGDSFG